MIKFITTSRSFRNAVNYVAKLDYCPLFAFGLVVIKLSSVSEMPDCWLVIVKPDIGMSTPESYKYYDEHGLSGLEHPAFDSFLSVLEQNDLSPLSGKLYNVLEHTVEDPVIGDIKNEMLSLGALGSMMTGSGTAVFGIFDSVHKAVAAKNALSEKFIH